MSEAEFIAREQEKGDAKLERQLRKINRVGFIGQDAGETLLINGLIELCGPSERNRYNHYRLTEKGIAELRRLQWRAKVS